MDRVIIGDCELICGDCMDVIATTPENNIDICVTSPPYNQIPITTPSGLFKEHNRKINDGYLSTPDDMREQDYQSWMITVFSHCMRICKGIVWINHKTRYRSKVAIHPLTFLKFDLFCEVVWNRSGSLVLNAKRYAPSHEYIYGFGKPHYWNRVNDTKLTVWTINPERNFSDHPCPYPVEIPSRLITSSCPENGIVLDPFMGIGTTGVACVREGRKFIGIEKERKYFDIACKRISDEVSRKKSELPFDCNDGNQLELFNTEV